MTSGTVNAMLMLAMLSAFVQGSTPAGGSRSHWINATTVRRLDVEIPIASLNPVSQQILARLSSNTSDEMLIQQFNVMRRMTGCSGISMLNLAYYGCYCGFGGSGRPVNGIDRCCKLHDECFGRTSCILFFNYLAIYRWSYHGQEVYCHNTSGTCTRQLCECDRAFGRCLSRFSCPHSRPRCQPR